MRKHNIFGYLKLIVNDLFEIIIVTTILLKSGNV